MAEAPTRGELIVEKLERMLIEAHVAADRTMPIHTRQYAESVYRAARKDLVKLINEAINEHLPQGTTPAGTTQLPG